MAEIPVTPPHDSDEILRHAADTAPLEAAPEKSLRVIDHLEAEIATRNAAARDPLTEPIAVVGMACRFPGAEDPAGFWQLLATGRDTCAEAPADRFPGANPRPRGHFLDRVPYGVDDRLFRLPPEEIRSLDPQQRLLLELAWEAFEDAGLPPSRTAGSRTGVFIGIEKADYARAGLYSGDPARITPYTATGIALSAAAGRLSYMFDLRGPCASLDAACASSLVALDQACASLRRGACDMALAGAVSLMLTPEPFVALNRLGALAADGRCKTFSAAADGYARGEGGAVLVLMPLATALARGARIHGLVLGSAVNHGGRSNGLTAPNLGSQEAVIREALAQARVAPGELDYLEAHGTGTPLGDPIEMAAIEAVFAPGRDAALVVGSVKTNIGHLETAAGMAGIVKVLLSLRHATLPPHLHCAQPSPHIPWSSLPITLPMTPTPWPRTATRRRIAGISAFGFTGTVAHAVLAEPPDAAEPDEALLAERPWHIVAVSARGEAALDANLAALAKAVPPAAPIADLAWSANTGRAAFEHRAVAVVAASADLPGALAATETDGPHLYRGHVRGADVAERIAFAFTGQGAQHRGMGRLLYATAPVFRAAIDRCAELLAPHLDQPLVALLHGPATDPDPLDDTAYTQPALFAFGYALAELWQSWGVRPALVLGHSVGEVVAAHLAGVFPLDDALRLIAARGRLVREHAAPGGMAVAFAAWAQIAPVLRAAGLDPEQEVVAAALNAPAATTIAGAPPALARAVAALVKAGITTRPLTVSHAFHSPLLRPALASFRRVAETLRYAAPRIPIVSGRTGRIADPAEIASPDYWCAHLLDPVRFADAVGAVAAYGIDCVVEVGPAAVLTGLARQCAGGEDAPAWLPSFVGSGDEWPSLLATLARLHVRGATIDWHGFDQGRQRRRVELPTYRFQRRHEQPEAMPAAPETLPSLPVPAARAPGPAARAVAADFAATTRLGRGLLRRAMDRLGLFAALTDEPALADLPARLDIVPAYHRLFAWLIDILVDDGAIAVTDGRVRAQPGTTATIDPADIVASNPDMADMVRLLVTCLDAYPEVLRGTRNPMEVLFPGGTLDLVESVYQRGAIAGHFNHLVAEAALAAISGGPVRLLEIGAGTGGTTQAVLPALANSGALLNYDFTDISAAFVRQAQARFGTAYPFLRGAVLDIERDGAAQGFTPGGYDVVLAANVLHATSSMARTLAETARLLRPGGVLILNEVTRSHEFIGMSFGLTPGWWIFEDAAIRLPHAPVLSLAGWRRALAEAGFDAVEVFGLEGDDMDDPLQAVIVARTVPATTAGATGQAATRDRLAGLIERISGIALGADDAETNLFELGLDSLLLMQIKQGIARDFGVEVGMGQFYEHLSTPARLAAFIAEQQPAAAMPARASAPPVGIVPVEIRQVGAAAPAMTLPAGASPTAAPGSLAYLVEQQLAVMKQQLALLAGQQPAALAAPHATPLRSAPAAPAVQRPPPRPAATTALDSRQQRFLAALIARYTARTARSKAYAAQARPILADWIATIGFRPELKEMIYPIVSVASEGSHMRDLDGNDYVDLAMGFGVGFFGHRPPFVVEALRERLDRGFELATQSDLAGETARLISELTGCERVVFSNTGTEAVMTAFRLARTVTGRRRVAHFKSAFHGFYDGVMAYGAADKAMPMVPGIVQSQVDDVLVLEYGAAESLRIIEAEAANLAGVMVEPVQSRNPDLQPREFLHELRRITQAQGIALIFDEMITGFRIHPGGAQAHFGVTADIVTYGKMIGGGLPVSVIAGSARFLDAIDGGPWQYGDASRPDATMTFFGGTFCRHPLSMAATHACLRYMQAQGPALQERMNRRTAMLAERLNTLFRNARVPFRVAWFASQFQVRHAMPGGETFQSFELAVFFLLLLEKGIYTWERRVCFLSIAHSDADLDRIASAVQETLHEMRQGGFFGTSPPDGGGRGAAPVRVDPASGGAPRSIALTPGQRDLAFRAAQGVAAATAYAEPLVLDFDGRLDVAALQRALDAVVARHDALRLCRIGERTAEIAPAFAVPIQRCQRAPLTEADDDEAARAWLAAICRRPFDLDSGPLLVAHLLELAPDRARFVLVLHHLAADGWSAGIVLQELAQLYSGFVSDNATLPLPLPLPPPVPLADYAAWYTDHLAQGRERAQCFWQDRLADPPPLALPTDTLRAARRDGIGRRLRHVLGAADVAALSAFGRDHRCSTFMVLLAAWQALLARLCGQQRIVLGIAAAGQAAMGVERLVGHCATMLPLAQEVRAEDSFAALLERLKADLLAVWDHQDLRPEDVVEEAALPQLRAAFNQDRDPGGWQFGSLTTRLVAAEIGFVKYELFLNAIETDETLLLDLDYDSGLFDQATVALWLDAYARLLRTVIAAPMQRLAGLALGNTAPAATHSAESSPGVLARIAGHAAAAPDRPALVRDGMVMTYGELQDRLARGQPIPVARPWIDALARMDEAGVAGLSAATFAEHVDAWIAGAEIVTGDVLRISDAAMTLAGLDAWAAPLAAGATIVAGEGGPTASVELLLPWQARGTSGTARLLLLGGATLLETMVADLALSLPDRALFLVAQPTGLPVALGVEQLDVAARGWRHIALRHPSRALSIGIRDEAGAPVLAGVVGTLHLGAQASDEAARLRVDGGLELLGPAQRRSAATVEAVLGAHPSVAEIALETDGATLRARVAVGESGLDAAALRRFLLSHLPASGLPAIIAVAAQLSDAATDAGDIAPDVPHPGATAAIVALYRSILGQNDVGPDDDFFDLGGDSLAATRLINRLRADTGTELPLRAVFEAPTPALLAARIVPGPPAPSFVVSARPAILPLAAAQHRLWFLEQLDRTGGAYGMQVALRLDGKLHTAALEAALNDVVARHESLRTRFPLYGDTPYQEILTPAAALCPLPVVALAGTALAETLAAETRFDLATDLPLQATLYRLAPESHVLRLAVHHIAGDEWSLLPLARDLRLAYAARSTGTAPDFPPLAVQYADFALWQQNLDLTAHEAFWRTALADLPAALDLPYDLPRRPHAGRRRAGGASFTLDAGLVARLRRLAHEARASLFMVLQAGLATLLMRYGAGEDIPLGTPIANRTHAALEPLIGCLVNTLVLRCRLDGRPSFRALLARLREDDLAAFAHQELPFERLVEMLRPTRTEGETPLFQVMLMLGRDEARALALPGLETRLLALPPADAKFDLTFGLNETETGDLAGTLEYDSGRFLPATAAQLVRHFVALLNVAAAAPDLPVQQLCFLTAEERAALLAEACGPTLAVPQTTVTALLDAQAAVTPTATALVAADGRRLDYAGLHAAAARVARRLAARGVGPGSLVAVICPRSPEMVIGILGVMKAGAAYLPLDPAYPPARLAFVLADAAPAAVIATKEVAARLPQDTAVLLDPAADEDALGQALTPATPDAPIYVIYTSGSTGQPKGVILPHRAVVNYLCWARATYHPEAGLGAPVNTSIGFDATVTSLFLPLISGSALHLVAEADEMEALAACLHGTRDFSLVKLTPAHLDILQQLMPAETLAGQARVLVIGGEALPAATIRAWRAHAPATRLINEYGPTETTVGCIVHEVAPDTAEDGAVPIGRPIANTRIYLLDAALQPVPPGAVGEIFIAGAGVADGYLGRPELTAERFLRDPFVPGGARMYRSGDRARRRADGSLDYLGRADTQIKLRGHRIEPGEIEAALLGMAGIAQAAVMLRRDAAGDGELFACLVAREGALPQPMPSLRRDLLAVLPAPLVPSAFVWLDSLPLSPNGKIDRARLLAMRPTSAPARPDRDANPVEAELCRAFADLLNRPVIGRDEDFFTLGGHSLMAARLVNRLRGRFDSDVTLSDLFAAPTPAGLAARIGARGTARAEQPALVPTPDAADHPVSPGQRRLWILDQIEPGRAIYTMTGAFEITGPVQPARLREALARLMARHESLRTEIVVRDGAPRQRIRSPEAPPFTVEDLSAEPDPAAHARILIAEETLRPFDLAAGPLWRVQLLRLSDAASVIVFNMHHAIGDGGSLGVLMREFSALYADADIVLPPLAVQHRDYVAWHQAMLHTPKAEADLAWWCAQLAGANGRLDLPTDRARGRGTSGRGAQVSCRLDPTVAAGLERLAAASGSTLFPVLVALVGAVLHRYTGQTDLVLGTVVAGRDHPALEDQIGFFANTLALRTRLDGAATMNALITQVAATVRAALAHATTPFEQVVEALGVEREPGRTPLFDVLVASETPLPPPQLEGTAVARAEVPITTRHFDLALYFRTDADGIELAIEYDSDLFDPWRIEALARHLSVFAANAGADPTRALLDIDILDVAERHRLEVTFNDTATDYPRDSGIVALFRDQVRLHPEAVAVSCEGEAPLSYDELDRRSDHLAGCLAGQAGVQAGDLVAIAAPRGAALIIGILGILKAGAAYVPIDPDYPEGRIAAMFDTAPIRCVLADTAAVRTPPSCPRLALGAMATGDGPAPDRTGMADDLAYVMFTSGTTGTPKAVAVPQRAVVRLVKQTDYVTLGPDERLLQTGAVSFDAATLEIWGMLLNGGTLYLAGARDLLDPVAMRRLLAAHAITTIWLTSSLFNHFVNHDPTMFAPLRQLLVGGERLSPPHIAKVRRQFPALRLLNGYGPTENTTFSAVHPIEAADETSDIPIGRPIANSRAYILGPGDRPAPAGVPGEICVAGDGLARGYLGRDDLTRERFVAHPSIHGERLYRTGDFGWWRPDGSIVYQGRRDRQVKIRGLRVEIGEIEAALLAQPGVTGAAVIPRRRHGDTELVAYVVGTAGRDVEMLRLGLGQRLPPALVPAHVIALERLPLDPNGKLDSAALPSPDIAIPAGPAQRPPANPLEAALAGLWADILGRETVGVDDGFFELGGHSLLAVRLVHRIRTELGFAVAPGDVFIAPTVARLASHLLAGLLDTRRASVAPDAAAILALPPAADYPAAATQRRLWFLHRLEAGPSAYNIAGAWHMRGALDRAALREAFAQLVQRHEALRTVFIAIDGEPRQRILDTLPPLPVEQAVDSAAEIEAICRQEAAHDFDLAGPLLRVRLLQRAADDAVLLITCHHLIADGWSAQIVNEELGALYAAARHGVAATLPPPVAFKDATAWLATRQDAAAREADRGYWRTQLAGPLPVLDLMTDHPRPALRGSAGAVVRTAFDPAVAAALRQLGAARNATMFAVAVALVKLLLHRLGGQDDILIGTPVANRDDGALAGVIGFLADTLVLRDRVAAGDGFAALLDAVAGTIANATAHAAVPFDEILAIADAPRDPSRSPLFDVMVTLAAPATTLALDGMAASPIVGTETSVQFDLTFRFQEDAAGLELEIAYATDLFAPARIARMATLLTRLAAAVVADPGQPLARLPLLDAAETRSLEQFAGRAGSFGTEQTLVALFEAQVDRTPERPAVVGPTRELSYRELDAAANALAADLLARGIAPEDRIGLALPASERLIIGILGILKAGGAYMPLDPEQPAERLRAMIDDAGCRWVVGDSDAAANGAWDGARLVPLRETPHAERPCVPIVPGNLAYVIFTSGSTGRPKGVMVEHRAVVNLVHGLWQAIYAPLADAAPLQVALVAAPVFDASVQQIFPALLGGHVLHPVPAALRRDGRGLLSLLAARDITVVDGTPSLLDLLLDIGLSEATLPALRHLVIGGEALRADTVRRLRANPALARVAISNAYGPTEATVDATLHIIGPDAPVPDIVPIGRPLPNVEALVLDSLGALVPVGVPGELCLGGLGLARGYAGGTAADAARFIAHPQRAGQRLYRTGDRVCWQEDGTLAYCGRGDGQMKIRGHRIEPDEIEAALLRCAPGARQAAVVARGIGAEAVLAAWLAADTPIAPAVLRRALADVLPAWMIPALVGTLPALPLTASGKIDRRALAAMPIDTPPATPPKGALERDIAAIWQDVLSCGEIGREQSFFELGGHSLGVLRVLARIEQRLGMALAVAAFYRAPTIADLAAQIAAGATTASTTLEPVPAAETYPLSPAQHRLWVIAELQPEALGYAMPAAFLLDGRLDAAALGRAVTALVARHEALRTIFVVQAGVPRQRVLPAEPVALTVEPVADLSAAARAAQEEAAQPFDLATAPPLRIRLLRLGPARHVLLFNMHHIIGDGLSLGIMAGELARLYEAFAADAPDPLPVLRLQYRDAVAAMAARRTGAAAMAARDWWCARFADPPLPLSLPTDFPRPDRMAGPGIVRAVAFEAGQVATLRGFAQAQGGTLFIVMLALVARLLHRQSGARDLVIGIPVSGRFHHELEEQVGLYAETCPIRIAIAPDEGLAPLIARVGATVQGALTHDAFGFDQLVEAVDPLPLPGRSPLFDVMVAWQAAGPVPFRPAGIAVQPFDMPVAGSQFDLCFTFLDRGDGLDLTIVARGDLYRPERVAGLGAALVALVAEMLDPAAVGAIPAAPSATDAVTEVPAGPSSPIGASPCTDAAAVLDAATGSTEQRLLRLWEDVLGRNGIGLDEAFIEAGGHSLKAARLVARMHAEFGRTLRLRDIFAHPTVRAQAALLAAGETVAAVVAAPTPTVADGAEILAPAAAAQRRLWVLAQLAADPAVYAITATLYLDGPLDTAALAQAFQALVARHEALRTVFHAEADEALSQRILPLGDGNFRLDLVADETEPTLVDFDLAAGPLFRARLVRLAPDRHRLDIALHHAVGDGWSIAVLARDLGAFYRAARQGTPPDLPVLALQYRDFVRRQDMWLAGAGGTAARDYWQEVLAGELPVLDLPADAPRPAVQTFPGALHRFTLNHDDAAGLRKLAQQHGTSLFAALLATVTALLYRYTGLEDVIVGMPVAGRVDANLENQVGLYVNTVPVRTRFAAACGFADLLAQVRDALTGALEHQAYPFDRLVEERGVPRDPSRSALFDVLVAMQDDAPTTPVLDGLAVRVAEEAGGVAKLDLSFHFHPRTDGIDVWLEYNTDLFAAERIERLAGHFTTLLRAACTAPDRPLGLLDLATAVEAEALQHWSAATDVPSNGAATVLAAFAARTAAAPDRMAVRCGVRTIGYRALDHWANGIAARLHAVASLRPGDRVAVALPRSAALPAAILGIWKAGLVYVPVDPAYPEARQSFLLTDAGCRVVIGATTPGGLPMIEPEDVPPAPEPPAAATAAGPDDPAYVIYTSGSTGTPKGVVIAHRNLAAFAPVLRDPFGLVDDDTVFALTTPSFDISLLELICPLAEGLGLIMADEDAVADPGRTLAALRASGATVLQVTPSRLALMLQHGSDLGAVRILLVGGERLPPELATAIRALPAPSLRAFNVYGPTETTIWSTAEPIGDAPPGIGWALSGEAALILSPAGQEQPVGIPGEIAIAGSGVGLGYLGRDELTAARFVAHLGKRLYRTGDRGWRRVDGGIVFLGRADDQVKLHGFRIEPGEIEAVLAAHPAVRQAAVAVCDIGGVADLVGYVSAPDLAIPGAGEEVLRAHLHARLPRHMVPVLLLGLPALPLLPSGKIDRKALPAPPAAPMAEAAPADALEDAVLAAWRAVLARPEAGADADFFDLGGHSLRAAALAGQLRATLGFEVGLRDVFLFPTARRLAAEIARRRAEAAPSLLPSPAAPDYPLSHAQRRLFALDALQPGSCAGIMAGAFRIEGALDAEALEQAFRAVIARHEVLRTAFRLVDGTPRQVVVAAPPFTLGCDDLSDLPDPEAAARAAADAMATTPFDLAAAPLLRARLLRLSADHHVLAFTLHHIVADGWSLGVLLDDLDRAYRSIATKDTATLPPATFQYRDHVTHERALAASPQWKRSRAWWQQLLAGKLPVLDLPMAAPRPARRSERGGQMPFTVAPEIATGVEALARRHSATPFMVLLAAWAVLFHRLTGAEDMILGSVSGNRDAPEFAEVVGCFVNPLPLRVAVRPDQGFAEILVAVRGLVLQALDHGAYPFDLLVRDLRAGGDPGRSPLFDIGFSWNALAHMARRQFAGCDLAPFAAPPSVAKYDLLIIAGADETGIAGVIEYTADLFDAAAIAALARQLCAVLEQIAAPDGAEVPITDLRLGQEAPTPAPLTIELQI